MRKNNSSVIVFLTFVLFISTFTVLGAINIRAGGTEFSGAGTDTPITQSTASNSSNLVCDVFPFLKSIAQDFCSGTTDQSTVSGAASSAANLVRFGLQLVFVGIIVVAIFVIIKSALLYIRSEGEEDKVQKAQKAIKTVFTGIAALFIGVIGLILVIAFFNASGALNIDNTPDIPIIRDFTDTLLE